MEIVKHRVSLLLFVCTLHVQISNAMQFEPHRIEMGRLEERYIYASGEIVVGDAQKLSKLLDSLGDEYPRSVRFSSAGGNLAEAMEIGFIIRQRGISTILGGKYIDVRHTEGINPWLEEGIETVIDTFPICLSACAYAFLGGVSREIQKPFLYGVHQFYAQGSKGTSSIGQLIQQALSNYVNSFVGNTKLLDYAVKTEAKDIRFFELSELKEIGVVYSHENDIGEWKFLEEPNKPPKMHYTKTNVWGTKTVTIEITKSLHRNRAISVFLNVSDPEFKRPCIEAINALPEPDICVGNHHHSCLPKTSTREWVCQNLRGSQILQTQFDILIENINRIRSPEPIYLISNCPYSIWDLSYELQVPNKMFKLGLRGL